MRTTAYKNKYNSCHYDRINLFVPKGEKDRLKLMAAAQGISLNEYICRLILKRESDILDRMQVAEKYRKMILCITGSTKEGYTVQLRKGYIHSESGTDTFYCRTKPELRKSIKKCLAQDI